MRTRAEVMGKPVRPEDLRTMRVTADELAKAIDQIRSSRTGELKSNYFFGALRAAEVPLWATPGSLVFLDREHDFHRVYFLARDLGQLSATLRGIAERPLVADYVTQGQDSQPIDAAFDAAGFAKVATYQRMANPNLAVRKAASQVTYAEAHETVALYAQLCRDFNVRLDHIPAPDRFAELVRLRQVLVHRAGDVIDGYAVYQLHGRKAHLNYWFSRPGSPPTVAIKLVADFVTDVTAKGITASFLWVETNKKGLIRLYKNIGYDADGLITHVYVEE
jgi:hypothetical protein